MSRIFFGLVLRENGSLRSGFYRSWRGRRLLGPKLILMKFPHTTHSFVPSSCSEATGGLGTVTGGANSSKELWMSTTTTHEIHHNSSRILKEKLRSM